LKIKIIVIGGELQLNVGSEPSMMGTSHTQRLSFVRGEGR